MKGQEEANKILADAEEQKQAILKKAEEEAARITAEAEKQAAALKKNAEGELKLFANRFIEGLKSDVANLLTGKIIDSRIAPVVQDKTFIQNIIIEIAKAWANEQTLVIQAQEADALNKFFQGSVKALLDSTVKLEKTAGKSTSFVISPADGSYKVAFGEEEFIEFFKDYLRPQLAELLF
ncbi:MAG: hypothetical protein LBH04_06260 [Tannerellaceae bacterium]|nr:hypothetical protein [Tannerellaceae bacterium]